MVQQCDSVEVRRYHIFVQRHFKQITNMWDMSMLFHQKSCFKKWYKKGFLGIMDFMLVGGCVVWNMLAKMKGDFRSMIDNSPWRMYVAKNMLNWKDPVDEFKSSILSPFVIDNHPPKPISKSATAHIRCVVCGLEICIQKTWNLNC